MANTLAAYHCVWYIRVMKESMLMIVRIIIIIITKLRIIIIIFVQIVHLVLLHVKA